MTKRILTFLLAMAMLFSAMPAVPVSAAIDPPIVDTQPISGKLPEEKQPGDIPQSLLRPMSEEEEWDEEIRNAPFIALDTDTQVSLSYSEAAYFRFVPETTDVYTFSATSGSDTFGVVNSHDRTLSEYDDDSGEGSDFALSVLLEAGQTYYFTACYYYTFLYGTFTVRLEQTHQITETVVTPATCSEDGLMTWACAHCGLSGEEVLPAGHQWQEGVCTVCGELFFVSGQCGDDLTWSLDHTGNLTVSGTGSTWNYAPFDALYGGLLFNIDESYYTTGPAPWADWYPNIRTLTLNEGITSIGCYTFWGLVALREVVVPEGVTELSYAAFAFCPELRSVVFPSTLWRLDVCFEYCDSLNRIQFEGPGPAASGGALSTMAEGLQIFYHSSRGGWTSTPDFWLVPEGTQWIDMDSDVSPEEFAFAQTTYEVDVGSTVLLGTNAGVYVSTLLTGWSVSDPSILYVSSDGHATGLKPGTVEVTLRSADGAYCATCTVSVTGRGYTDSGITELAGTFDYNLSENNYEVWDDLPTSFVTMNGGTLERIQFVDDTGVVISRYNENLAMLSEEIMEPELPVFGGFFAGESWNFLLYGQNNPEEKDETEVLRIVRYTKDWQRVDHCSIFGANTTVPFDAGTADFAEENGVLYLHTCHEMYTTEDGLNHQANMTFAIDQQTMTVVDQWYDVMNISFGYVSHSFSQRIRTTDQYIFRVDHGDAHLRSICLTRAEVDGTLTSVHYTSLLDILGRSGDNYTGVSLGGFELSSTNCLVAGNSIDQSDAAAWHPQNIRNVFLAVADQDLAGSRILWLTEYTEEDPVSVRTPQLVKVAEDLFVVLWEQQKSNAVSTCAVAVTGSGEVLGETLVLDCRLSDCQPIVTEDGLISWFTADSDTLRLYQLSWQQMLADPGAVEILLGHQYTATVTEPTCTEEGYTTHTCINCCHSYVDSPVEPLGHALTAWTIIQEPTCTTHGTEQQECLRCGEIWTRSTDFSPHDYEIEVTEPTCLGGGYTTYECRVCGHWKRDDHVDPLGHNMGEWFVSIEPTCIRIGEEKKCCSRCNYAETRDLPLADHVYTGIVTEPTCTGQGYTTYTCETCDTGYVSDYTDALGHDFSEWVITVEPTCMHEGEERRECGRCHLKEARSVPTGDHVYRAEITDPTCTEQGYTTYTCDCGESYVSDYVPAAGHDWSEWSPSVEPTCTEEGQETRVCTVCGDAEYRVAPATGHSHTAIVTAPTCTEDGYTTYTCRCGDSYTADPTDALGHDWGEWAVYTEPTCTEEGGERRSCTRCDETEVQPIPVIPHSYTAVVTGPTCTEDGYTTYTCACGESYTADAVDALGHDWEDIRCSRCGVLQHNPFTDVTEQDFFFESVLWAVVNGVTSGTGPETFSPGLTCTRAQVVTFLWRAMGKPMPENKENPFSDVSEGSYYYEAVLWAVEQGITAGTGADTFSPDQSCTRAQVVTFLWRTMGRAKPEQAENPFSDVTADAYYYDAVLWAVEQGITAGATPTTFNPNAPCTRAQVVTFLYRAMG